MAATQGHTQSLHTNALDEALALPTDFSARIARNTQLLLQQESGTTRVIDPWGGSAYVEKLTYDLARRAWAHIEEVTEHGGMAQAIDDGIPKLRIEEAAARTQARIDSGRQPVIGVNKYRTDADEAVEVLRVDNAQVLAGQQAKLAELRASRDAGAVADALRRLTDAARAADEGRRDSSLDSQPAQAGRRRGPGACHRRGDLRRARGGLGAALRSGAHHLGCVPRRGSRHPGPWRRRGGWRRRSTRPRDAVRGSWSPRWARTATTAARR